MSYNVKLVKNHILFILDEYKLYYILYKLAKTTMILSLNVTNGGFTTYATLALELRKCFQVI